MYNIQTSICQYTIPIFFICLCGCFFNCAGQTKGDLRVQQMVVDIGNFHDQYPAEKVYLHFDKPYYASGDTIWFKAYLLTPTTYQASSYSAKLYVELLNDSNKLVERLTLPISAGLANGDFVLDAQTIQGGTYTIRAYTNWMQNWGTERFFYKQFSINSQLGKPWLITENHHVQNIAGNNTGELFARLTDIKGVPIANKILDIKLLDSNRVAYHQDITTTDDGVINSPLSFTNTHSRQLTLLIEGKQNKGGKLRIPFYSTGKEENIDFQFLPENGNLVVGLYNKVGFKAIGEAGESIDCEGAIYNSKNEKVTSFSPTHSGMGFFTLTPKAGETFTAKIKTATGAEKIYNLPVPKTSGRSFRVDALSNPDTINISLTVTPDLISNDKYYLLAQSADSVYFARVIAINQGFCNIHIPKKAFVAGIVKFTLLNPNGEPVNERKIFVGQFNKFRFQFDAITKDYHPGDSVSIGITVHDNDDKPIAANFSIAVTDDHQLKVNTQKDNILTNMLLTSEIMGTVEKPAWYFDQNNKDAAIALDNLMLTQGWVNILPAKLKATKNEQPLFLKEPDINVSGVATNLFNKPVANLKVTLMAMGKDVFLDNTITDAKGNFIFDNLPVSDSAAYVLKIHNAKGNTPNASITVNKFKPADLKLPYFRPLTPWYFNTDTAQLNYVSNSTQHINQMAMIKAGNLGGKLLKEVKIKDRRALNITGVDGEDIYYPDINAGEKELIKAADISLFDFLSKTDENFHSIMNKFRFKTYDLKDIIIDNISVMRFFSPKSNDIVYDIYEHFKFYLDYIKASDLKQVVIYHRPYPVKRRKTVTMDFASTMVIATRSRNGPFLRSPVGTAIYRPEQIYLSRQFYQPRYKTEKTFNVPDARSTILWQPNLVTDASGKAAIWFYATDKPTTYTLIMEGTDLSGGFGYATKQITINK